MKSCPSCQRTFPDEYSYCLTDGTPLENVGSLTEEPTVVRPDRPTPDTTPSTKRRRGRGILIFLLAALLSLSLGVTAAVLYFFWPRKTDNSENRVTASPTPTVSATPTERSPSPTPKPSPSPQPSASATPDPGEQLGGSDPGTTRITFRPGRTVETISVTVQDRRSFVLTARAGQYLRAEIADDPPDYCVEFDDESPVVEYRTHAGDNYLTVVNTCNHPARLTLTVSIR